MYSLVPASASLSHRRRLHFNLYISLFPILFKCFFVSISEFNGRLRSFASVSHRRHGNEQINSMKINTKKANMMCSLSIWTHVYIRFPYDTDVTVQPITSSLPVHAIDVTTHKRFIIQFEQYSIFIGAIACHSRLHFTFRSTRNFVEEKKKSFRLMNI